MRRWVRLPGIAAVVAVLAAVSADTVGAAVPDPVTFALLGDTPYGDAQRAEFPRLVDAINADSAVQLVLHAGDVKSGAARCDDARLTDVAGLFNTFADPFVLTPGDNEWTDCHTPTAGRYLPVERLEAVRRILFPQPGRTLGRRTMVVATQAHQAAHPAYRENVRFEQGGVVFASVHVVGADNDLQPWSGLVGGDRPAVRQAEFEARRAAALSWVDAAFTTATSTGAAGVLLLLQAEPLTTPGFADIRRRIADRAGTFGRPVLLVHGDEHVYEVQRAYAGVPNLTRLETYGATARAWLRVTVDARTPEVFSWAPRAL